MFSQKGLLQMFPGMKILNARMRDILDCKGVKLPEKPARLIDIGQDIKRLNAAAAAARPGKTETANCNTPKQIVLHTGRGRIIHAIESLRHCTPFCPESRNTLIEKRWLVGSMMAWRKILLCFWRAWTC